MYFPISGLEINPLVPPAIAFTISYFTSMGGVSGAFILLPVQVSVLGFTSPAVSSTNQLYNMVAIPGGVYRYIREKRMVWPLTWAVIIGTLPGVLVGTLLRIRFLPNPRHFKVFVAMVLLYIGIRMVLDVLRKPVPQGEKSGQASAKEGSGQAGTSSTTMSPVRTISFTWRSIVYEFEGTTYTASTPGIGILSLIVGIVGGIYGIGGGAIVAPFFVAIFRLPVHTVAGAALMGTFVTSSAAVIFYQLIAPLYPDMAIAPDWKLGALFGLGGLAGTYLGARTQRYVPARAIKWILLCCVFFVVVKYALAFFS